MLRSLKIRMIKGKSKDRVPGKAGMIFVQKWRRKNRLRKTVENPVENVKNPLRIWGKEKGGSASGSKEVENGGMWKAKGTGENEGRTAKGRNFPLNGTQKTGRFCTTKTAPFLFKNRGYF